MYAYTYNVVLTDDETDPPSRTPIRIFTTSPVVSHLYDIIMDQGLFPNFCAEVLERLKETVAAKHTEAPLALAHHLRLCGTLPPPNVIDEVPLLFTVCVDENKSITLHSSYYDGMYEQSWPFYSDPGFEVSFNGGEGGRLRLLTYSKRIYDGMLRMIDEGTFPIWVSSVSYELMHSETPPEDTEILEGRGIVCVTQVDTTSPKLKCYHLSTDDNTTFH